MITSEQTSLLSEIRQTPIPKPVLFEMESRLKHRVHSMMLNAFNQSGLSNKELAARLGWDEARVSRCLGMAGNLTLKTISALLTAIGVDLDDPTCTSFDELERRLNTENQTTEFVPIVVNWDETIEKSLSNGGLFAQMLRGDFLGSAETIGIGYESMKTIGAAAPQGKGKGKVIDMLSRLQKPKRAKNIGVPNARENTGTVPEGFNAAAR